MNLREVPKSFIVISQIRITYQLMTYHLLTPIYHRRGPSQGFVKHCEGSLTALALKHDGHGLSRFEEAVGNRSVVDKLRWSTLGYHHDWDTKVSGRK